MDGQNRQNKFARKGLSGGSSRAGEALPHPMSPCHSLALTASQTLTLHTVSLPSSLVSGLNACELLLLPPPPCNVYRRLRWGGSAVWACQKRRRRKDPTKDAGLHRSRSRGPGRSHAPPPPKPPKPAATPECLETRLSRRPLGTRHLP